MAFRQTDFVDIADCINAQKYIFYAHRQKETNQKETLQAHTKKCQMYFLELIEKKQLFPVFDRFLSYYFEQSLSDSGRTFFYRMTANVITFHDLGKINPQFQSEKMDHHLKGHFQDFLKEGSKHSNLSSLIYIDYFMTNLKVLEKKEKGLLLPFVFLYAYLISKHHGSLQAFQNYLEKFTNGTMRISGEKLQQNDLYLFQSQLQWGKMQKICRTVDSRLRKNTPEKALFLSGYLRFLFSLLIASDYYATTAYMNDVEIHDFGNLADIATFQQAYQETTVLQQIRKYEKERYKQIEVSPNEKDIFVLRNELFLDIESKLERHMDDLIFFIEAPTGSGKSNVAFNCSFKLIQEKTELNKILYVYPFNTLVEQNLNNLEKIFGNNPELFQQIAVVNALTPMKVKGYDQKLKEEEMYTEHYEKILLDRQFLNYPFVLTTHVSLFDILFGVRRESAFAFHQIANSVIVLDEIQSYKNQIWTEIILFLEAFSKLFHCKVIVMSATLPDFTYLLNQKSEIYSRYMNNDHICTHLVDNREKYFAHPIFKKRVQLNFELLEQKVDMDTLHVHIAEQVEKNRKILVEFICKKTAVNFFQLLKEDEELECVIELMTGDDSFIERNRILKEVTSEQPNGLILIATQVVEAGIDIDMDIGYKNISKLDSEEQFLGRINRSGKKLGRVYFFKVDEPSKVYHKDVRISSDYLLEQVKMQEILNEKRFSDYYDLIMESLKNNFNDSWGPEGLRKFFEDELMLLDYAGIAKRMELIEDNRQLIWVFFNGEIIDEKTGEVFYGKEIWDTYVQLLENEQISFAKKKVKLAAIRAKMNYFLYQLPSMAAIAYYDEQVGEIYYIADRENYFKEGKLNLVRNVDFIY